MKNILYTLGLAGLATLTDATSDTCAVTTTLAPITVTKCNAHTIAEGPSGSSIIYTTVYSQLCSTGLTASTYTITESCNGACQTPTAGKIPSGFTTEVVTCSTCGSTPVTATITCPISVPTGSAGNAATATAHSGSGSKSGSHSSGSFPGSESSSITAAASAPSSSTSKTAVITSASTPQQHLNGLTLGLLVVVAGFISFS